MKIFNHCCQVSSAISEGLWIELARIWVKRFARKGNGFPLSFAAIFFLFTFYMWTLAKRAQVRRKLKLETVLKIKINNTGEGCLDTVKTTGVVVRGGELRI